jgi:hypothetical protein
MANKELAAKYVTTARWGGTAIFLATATYEQTIILKTTVTAAATMMRATIVCDEWEDKCMMCLREVNCKKFSMMKLSTKMLFSLSTKY